MPKFFFFIAGFLFLCLLPLTSQAGYFAYSDVVIAACNHLHGKTYEDVAADIADPTKMMFLCEQAGISWPVRGEAVVVDGRPGLKGTGIGQVPFGFDDEATAAAAGRKLEEYNIWYSTDTQFGMRLANHTDKTVSEITVGFKASDCLPYEDEVFEKFMRIKITPIPPSVERVVKWNIPAGLRVAAVSCLDILRATSP